MTKKILVLYSGGLDSFILYHYAKSLHQDVTAVYYEHGQPAMEKELAVLPDFVIRKKVEWLDETNRPVPMKSKPNEGSIFIPGRNMVFITLAASQFLPDEIWMGSVANEVSAASTDKNETFCIKMEGLLNYVLQDFLRDDIRVRIPFVENAWGKAEAIKWALDNGISEQDIYNTPSCYDEGDPCGVCIQCLRRWSIFGLLDMAGENYKSDPAKSEMLRQSLVEILQGKDKAQFYYDEIVPWVKKYVAKNPDAPALIEDFAKRL